MKAVQMCATLYLNDPYMEIWLKLNLNAYKSGFKFPEFSKPTKREKHLKWI